MRVHERLARVEQSLRFCFVARLERLERVVAELRRRGFDVVVFYVHDFRLFRACDETNEQEGVSVSVSDFGNSILILSHRIRIGRVRTS